jgi:hypothetical protein
VKESTPLADEVARFGADAFVMSVTPESKPHLGPVQPSFDGTRFEVLLLPGSRTERNARVNPVVCLHWPGSAATGGYSLIVDGEAEVDAREHETALVVTPVKAVLHKLGEPGAQTNACGHDCRSVSL